VVRGLVIGSALLVALGACSDNGDSGDRAARTTTTLAPAKLAILVTNDDGYAAEGLDTVVEALRKLPNVDVTVVAPATDRSGTGGQTTPGTLTASEAATASGYPATAVEGFPADTIRYALSDVLREAPDLVVSGINEGPNLGPIAAVSGTVGAAKAAVREGIPALAASQGLGDPIDYAAAADLAVDWVQARRRLLATGEAEKVVVNLNVPTCASGSVRGVKQVPLATQGTGLDAPPNCASTTEAVTDDVLAFLAGFASATELTADGQTVTTSTTWPATG
jgi:5'-nucleotidase